MTKRTVAGYLWFGCIFLWGASLVQLGWFTPHWAYLFGAIVSPIALTVKEVICGALDDL